MLSIFERAFFQKFHGFGIFEVWKMILYLHGNRSIIECIAIDCEMWCATRTQTLHDYCMYIFGLELPFFSSLLIELSVSAVFYNRLSVIWNDSCFFLLFIPSEAIITCCRVSHVAIRIHTLTWQLYRFHVYVFCLFLTASWIELRRLRLIIFFIQLLLLMFKHLRLPGVATYFFFYYSFSTFNVYK